MGQKQKRFRESRRPFPLRDIRKNPRSMYARVPQAMAQFVLKIEKLSHIMGPTPILEIARAYDLRPRLWLLSSFDFDLVRLDFPLDFPKLSFLLQYLSAYFRNRPWLEFPFIFRHLHWTSKAKHLQCLEQIAKSPQNVEHFPLVRDYCTKRLRY